MNNNISSIERYTILWIPVKDHKKIEPLNYTMNPDKDTYRGHRFYTQESCEENIELKQILISDYSIPKVFLDLVLLKSQDENKIESTDKNEDSNVIGTKKPFTYQPILKRNIFIQAYSLKENGEKEEIDNLLLECLETSYNGLFQYKYVYNPNKAYFLLDTNFDIIHAIYHAVKAFYHKHEHHDGGADSIVNPYCFNEFISIKKPNNPAILHYLQLFEFMFTADIALLNEEKVRLNAEYLEKKNILEIFPLLTQSAKLKKPSKEILDRFENFSSMVEKIIVSKNNEIVKLNSELDKVHSQNKSLIIHKIIREDLERKIKMLRTEKEKFNLLFDRISEPNSLLKRTGNKLRRRKKDIRLRAYFTIEKIRLLNRYQEHIKKHDKILGKHIYYCTLFYSRYNTLFKHINTELDINDKIFKYKHSETYENLDKSKELFLTLNLEKHSTKEIQSAYKGAVNIHNAIRGVLNKKIELEIFINSETHYWTIDLIDETASLSEKSEKFGIRSFFVALALTGILAGFDHYYYRKSASKDNIEELKINQDSIKTLLKTQQDSINIQNTTIRELKDIILEKETRNLEN